MTDNNKNISLSKAEKTLFFSLCLAALATIIVFVASFYSWSYGDPKDWSDFADYFSGILNPVIGIVTVFLIFLTLATTRGEAKDTRDAMNAQRLAMEDQQRTMGDELQQLKDQQNLTDLYRRLEGVLAELNRMLDLPAPALIVGQVSEPLQVLFSNAGITVREYLDIPRLDKQLLGVEQAPVAKHTRNHVGAFMDFFQPFVALLEELDVYCTDYDTLAGNKNLTDFYRRRVRFLLRVLRAGRAMSKEALEGLDVAILNGDNRLPVGRAGY